ncbi:hypothetical protein GIB67_021090 [Kingdonia uniflora]|uniref:USP domain-containing protein n=1 Tax=Kingdonia uniflora TaxID=39325 RepID=A0A7J7N6U7_9MAGN|nr:hypothetical protein GIB67_021090 [Kingdonia uniflora]
MHDANEMDSLDDDEHNSRDDYDVEDDIVKISSKQLLDWRLSQELVMEDCTEEERLLNFKESVRCKVFLGFTSNLISSGVRETVRYLVKHRMAREVPSSPTAFATSNYNMDMRHIQLHYGYASHFSLCMGPSKVDYDDQTPKDLIRLRSHYQNQSTMADALIFVVVDQLAPFLFDKLKKETCKDAPKDVVLSAPKDVQELHDIFDNIRDVLDDAEKRHVKNVLLNLEKNEIKKVPESTWLEKLKDVSYEMEDVLDEWRTKILKSEISVDGSSAPDGIDGARTGKKKVHAHSIYRYLENPSEELFKIKNDEYLVAYRLSKNHEVSTKLEIVHHSKDKYCPNCKEHQQAMKKLDRWRLPEILVVHLKRFSYSRYMKNKLDTFVNFPISNLDLSKYVTSNAGAAESHVYKLYAINNHYGGLGGGQYFAYSKAHISYPYADQHNIGTLGVYGPHAFVGLHGTRWLTTSDQVRLLTLQY